MGGKTVGLGGEAPPPQRDVCHRIRGTKNTRWFQRDGHKGGKGMGKEWKGRGAES
jgi:hypothetical protein